MICYRDRAYCSEKRCGNLDCSRNQKTIDQESLKRTGLPLSIMAIRSFNCGYLPETGEQICARLNGKITDDSQWPEENQPC